MLALMVVGTLCYIAGWVSALLLTAALEADETHRH